MVEVVVVGLCVRKYEAGLGQNPAKPSAMARFWVCRMKMRSGAMVGGGAVMWSRWWWWWDSAYANTRWKRGLGAKSRETERDGSVLGAPHENAIGGGGGRWCGCVVEMVVVVGLCARKHEAGGGTGAKSPETEHDGSISGVLFQTTAEGGGGRWRDEVDEVVVVVGLRVRKREAREEAGAKSHETERDGSISGAPCPTAVEGNGGRWCGCAVEVVVVVGLCVRKREAGGGAGGRIR